MDISAEIAKVLKASLLEDLGAGDVTSKNIIPADHSQLFRINTRENIVFCGAEVITQAFGARAKIFAKDGESLAAGATIAETDLNTQELLGLERSVLNLIQFLSGIATETTKYVEAVKNTKAKILDTRKTIPGLRVLSKYAVKCGGGQNHRMGLFDMVMIKDNHIKAAGGIEAAVQKSRVSGLKVEVECENLQQVQETLAANADIILADNMSCEQLKDVVKLVAGKIPIEASGNVNLKSVKAIAETGVDFISTSKITLARPVDIGLDEII